MDVSPTPRLFAELVVAVPLRVALGETVATAARPRAITFGKARGDEHAKRNAGNEQHDRTEHDQGQPFGAAVAGGGDAAGEAIVPDAVATSLAGVIVDTWRE